jgi:[3-methyl-2-oxobutanoate dehydrogenase (acetyl-transferring)] kinase
VLCHAHREMCELKYGHAPDVRINGHLSATFPYVAPALDYIMLELLKNAMRFSSMIRPAYNIKLACLL